MTLQLIKARDLNAADNIRSTISPAALDEMKASILATGIIQNLVAVSAKSGLDVIAGITRLTAVHALQLEGKLDADYAVPVLVRTDIDANSVDAIAIAMTENIIRQAMDFVDECLAMNRLARGGKSEGDIAALFGLRVRTVRERLLIAHLNAGALDLVRNKTRDLDWARALTMADAALQTRIVEDVLSNPAAWQRGDDIRTYLTKATIPADKALFDISLYTGPIIHDFFDGDKLTDTKQFWDLQNAEIDARMANLEAAGYTVTVLRGQPFPEWLYDTAPDGEMGEAFIEVMPSGAVRTITGKVKIQGQELLKGENDGSIDEVENTNDTLAAHEVRPTARVLDYAKTHRSLMVQTQIAADFDTALRVNVLTMLGVQGTVPGTLPLSLNANIATGNKARNVMNAHQDDVQAVVNAGRQNGGDAGVIAMILSMDRSQLESLFCILTAQRSGQTRAGLEKETTLITTLGANINVRSFWTPDDTFFNLMGTEDLQRLAAALVPGITAAKASKITRPVLMRQILVAFKDAQEGVIGGEAGKRLNTWVPGVMSFPATLETTESETVDDASLEDMLFG